MDFDQTRFFVNKFTVNRRTRTDSDSVQSEDRIPFNRRRRTDLDSVQSENRIPLQENMSSSLQNEGQSLLEVMPDSLQNGEQLPFTLQCDVEYEGGPDCTLRFQNCTKNKGHPKFIPVNKLEMEDLPESHRTDEMLGEIIKVCDRTVRIVVNYTSINRPEGYMDWEYRGKVGKFHGTGFLFKKIERKFGHCPCNNCKNSDKQKNYFLLWIRTAKHVVYDDSEAERCVVEFFYDSTDRSGVIECHGLMAIDVGEEFHRLDMSYVLCVTHNKELLERLDEQHQLTHRTGLKGSLDEQELESLPFPFMVSHPHGASKHVTFGTNVWMVYLCKLDKPCTYIIEPGRKCRLSKNNSFESLEVFQQLVNSDKPCKPGVVYTIKEGITLTSKPESISLCYHTLKDMDDDLRKFIKFPNELEFTFGNQNSSFPDVEFEMKTDEFKYLWRNIKESHYEYDMDSCPGSSGAPVCGIGTFGPSGGFFSHAGNNESYGTGMTGRWMQIMKQI